MVDEDGYEVGGELAGWLVEAGKIGAICLICATADVMLTSVMAGRMDAHVIDVPPLGEHVDPRDVECMHCYPHPRHDSERQVYCSRANGWVGGRLRPRALTPVHDAQEEASAVSQDLLLADDQL